MTEAAKLEDLRPWGYAPGGYSFRCGDCPENPSFSEMSIGDKRSWRCRDHAIAARDAELQLPAAPSTANEVTQEDRDAAADLIKASSRTPWDMADQAMRSGMCDYDIIVQAFKNHRLQSRASTANEGEAVDALWSAALELARKATALSAALDGQEQYRTERLGVLQAMEALAALTTGAEHG